VGWQALMDQWGYPMTYQPDQGGVLNGPWIWLFPASYAVHVAEEGLAGERSLAAWAVDGSFYRWIRRVVGREVGGRTFLAVNLAYETAMGAAVWRARSRVDFGWIVATMGTITAINGVGHLAGSVATRSYSPGLVSGIAVWTPLGLFAVVRARRLLPRAVWRRSIAAGVAVNAAIGLLALPLSHKVVDRNGAGLSASFT
jgi:hypothetical protein